MTEKNIYKYNRVDEEHTKRKRDGCYYTPKEVCELVAKIISSSDVVNSYTIKDPACGSGGLLDACINETVRDLGVVEGVDVDSQAIEEANENFSDVNYKDFRCQNSLEHDLGASTYVVANPPYSLKWEPSSASPDCFIDGLTAPKGKADYAFINKAINSIDEKGQAVIILPHGVLFRGAVEGKIRKHLIKELNCLDAVVGLPTNIFHGTSIPTCILVFKKGREHKDDILFIDASSDFEKVKTQNILRPEHIERIVETYRNRETVDKYSYVAKLSEVKENDYNLNIPRYVDTFEEEEPIDINAVALEVRAIDKDMVAIDEKLKGFCDELGIEAPF